MLMLIKSNEVEKREKIKIHSYFPIESNDYTERFISGFLLYNSPTYDFSEYFFFEELFPISDFEINLMFYRSINEIE